MGVSLEMTNKKEFFYFLWASTESIVPSYKILSPPLAILFTDKRESIRM